MAKSVWTPWSTFRFEFVFLLVLMKRNVMMQTEFFQISVTSLKKKNNKMKKKTPSNTNKSSCLTCPLPDNALMREKSSPAPFILSNSRSRAW